MTNTNTQFHNAKELITFYREDYAEKYGEELTNRMFLDFLEDGEALMNEGFTDADEEMLEEAYGILEDELKENI